MILGGLTAALRFGSRNSSAKLATQCCWYPMDPSCWHVSDVAFMLDDVGSQEQRGNYLLLLSISHLDPQPALRTLPSMSAPALDRTLRRRSEACE
jgi:hypothetical protein